MNKKNYRISQKKLNKATELLILGQLNYSEIAQVVGISRNTLQRIREDEEVHNKIHEYSNNEIKLKAGKAASTLINLLDAKSEMVRLEAAKQILGLNGIQITDKLDITSENVVIIDDI